MAENIVGHNRAEMQIKRVNELEVELINENIV